MSWPEVPGVRPDGDVGELEPGTTPAGELGRETPVTVRDGIWLGLGRAEGAALGRAGVTGRVTTLEPREGLGPTDGREEPPLEGRGAALEPREPWLDGRE